MTRAEASNAAACIRRGIREATWRATGGATEKVTEEITRVAAREATWRATWRVPEDGIWSVTRTLLHRTAACLM